MKWSGRKAARFAVATFLIQVWRAWLADARHKCGDRPHYCEAARATCSRADPLWACGSLSAWGMKKTGVLTPFFFMPYRPLSQNNRAEGTLLRAHQAALRLSHDRMAKPAAR